MGSRKPLNAEARHEVLLRLLDKQKRLTVEELVERLAASTATVRRDLQKLEAKGKLLRTHGGAVHADTLGGEVDFLRREQEQQREKECIGLEGIKQIDDGAVVFLDAGSTCLQLARVLMKQEMRSHVFTNSLPILQLGQRLDIPVTVIGGRLRRVSQALVGSVSLGWISRLHFDIVFLGASGISATGGFSTTELDECAVKTGVLSRANRKVVLADSGKWNRPAAIRFADWKEVDCWITDDALDSKMARILRGQKGIEVIRTKPEVHN